VAGEKPVVVISDEAGAHARIERFARGRADAPRWLLAVSMVSEGVDVPRLLVAAYATVRRTDLFFRRAVGRVVRRRDQDPEDLSAAVFLPADPTLTACAERVEVELRPPTTDEPAAFDVERPLGVARPADFQALDAHVEPGGVIVAGVHYRREEVDAARRLLRELGQPERALRSVLVFVRRERVGATNPAPAPSPPVSAHRRVEAQRRALDRLARRWAQLRLELDPSYTWPGAGPRQPRNGRCAARRGRRAPARQRPRLPAPRARQAGPPPSRAGRAPADPGQHRRHRPAPDRRDPRTLTATAGARTCRMESVSSRAARKVSATLAHTACSADGRRYAADGLGQGWDPWDADPATCGVDEPPEWSVLSSADAILVKGAPRPADHIPMLLVRLAVMTVLATITVSTAALPSQAATRGCGGISSEGIASIRATGVSCAKARTVAKAFRATGPRFPSCCYPYRFRCTAGRFRDEMSRGASCRRGRARFRFLMFAT
jgi:hypothetical protein